jgi:transcriptional regulator of aromatic amino acid metabolism
VEKIVIDEILINELTWKVEEFLQYRAELTHISSTKHSGPVKWKPQERCHGGLTALKTDVTLFHRSKIWALHVVHSLALYPAVPSSCHEVMHEIKL